MSSDYQDQRLDRELMQEQLQAAVLRGQLGLVTGEDDAVSVWLGELAVRLSDDTEVVRLDASQAHSASGLVQALARALDVVPDDLLAALRERAQTLPLALVVDNGECLGSRALDTLRNLLAKAGGGLGVLMGGDPELADLLSEARLEPVFRATADDEAVVSAEAPESVGAVTRPWPELVPWKHLLAVVGLLLLVWLFWPADPSGGASTTSLELPAPESRKTGSGVDEPPDPRDVPDNARKGEKNTSAQTQPRPSSATSGEPEQMATEAQGDPAETPEPQASPEPAVDPSSLDAELAYRGEDWLLMRPPERWMLQLALAGDEKRARDLLDRLGPERGAYYRARRDGEVVYIVLAGPYGSRDQALGARSGLPGFFRERGPFPRSVKEIAAEIRD